MGGLTNSNKAEGIVDSNKADMEHVDDTKFFNYADFTSVIARASTVLHLAHQNRMRLLPLHTANNK